MLRRAILLSTCTMALSGAAIAADLPPPSPPPLIGWTGFYAGLNAGGLWTNSNNVGPFAFAGACDPTFAACAASPNYSVTSANLATFSLPLRSSGFIGGGQAGYNYQIAGFVAGVEADIQGKAGAAKSAFSNSSLENPNFIGLTPSQSIGSALFAG